MKKLAISILASITLISSTINTVAHAKLVAVLPPALGATVSGELKNVECSTNGSQDVIKISVSKLKDYNVFYLPNPDRVVIDIPKAKAPATQNKIDVGGRYASSVRYAQFNEDTARVVVDLKEMTQYFVRKESGMLVLYLTKPIVDNVIYYNDDDGGNLVLDGIKLFGGDNGSEKLFTETFDSNGKKYTIAFPNTLGEVKSKIVSINDGYINMIRIYNSKSAGKTTMTIYAKENFTYEVIHDDKLGSSVVSFRKEPSPDEGDGKQETEEPKDEKPETENPEPKKLDVKYSAISNGDRVALTVGSYEGYNVFRLTDPDRIVIDIPNASVPEKQGTIKVDSGRISTVRYAQHNSSTARVVIDTKGLPHYSIAEKDGQLIIDVQSPTYKNLVYHNSGDRVYFSLKGAKLTEGGADLKKFYTGKYDSSGQKYTITFRSNLANIGTGTLEINDSYLKSIEISTDEKSKNTSITFNAKDKFVYEIITRADVNDTAITVLKPYSAKDKLVVIDAGHGGSESGATSAGVKEKDLNLDIAMRLNSLLKSKGVNTYMLREDDSYVGLYERAYIANSLNATLFLSIHNNAFNNKETGTETLYHPNSAKSKKFAQIIQNELISTLKTKDRKLKERPGLVVLKATKMPAALAEIAFVDSAEDRKKLLDENFRQKAAEALCRAIIKALEDY
ncbi:N-acetylmuramoyl-L-alanine amidase [Clostridium thermosuccinogenes]|uniref:N-acetylmuramoyl-L-alanine amidase n=1 Tax=Clostridium thermosuccinogenes TaxID=84032 RepID=UPI000CCC3F74|nr:N-acetylmuramoyl-L-alanine amidase [Pseudoclostridium thermosuccinogenes]PNT94204.1 hypothetical protein CDQ83_12215 [Pseudoclostridium thermosuccinogenes]